MLEITAITTSPAEAVRGLTLKKLLTPQVKVTQLLNIYANRLYTLKELEKVRAEMNGLARQIGIELGKGNDVQELRFAGAKIKQEIARLEGQLYEFEVSLNEALVALPNLPHPSVPPGESPEENAVVHERFISAGPGDWKAPHWELAERRGLVDFKAGVKLTGTGFPVYRGKGARLQRALINFFLDAAIDAGYVEVQPPILVNGESAYATGQLPDKEGQMYHVERDGLYLVPTAEVPLTNLYRDVIIGTDELPVRLCGYTPCFRREAGSHGAHVRGLNRLHQFDKVEIVQIVEPEQSYDTLEDMRRYVEGLMERLGLPYRTLLLCTGDMSFASAKTYDIEAWSAAQERWLEVSSVSNFETFQANRLKCRIRDGKGTRLAHTLNGSALALPRIVAALLEFYQQEDGSIRVPEVLRPYTGFDQI